jgi:hypothetical protein
LSTEFSGELEFRLFDKTEAERHDHSKFFQGQTAFEVVAISAAVHDVIRTIAAVPAFGL